MAYSETPTTESTTMPSTMLTKNELASMLRRAEIENELGFRPSALLMDAVNEFLATAGHRTVPLAVSGHDIVLVYEYSRL